MTTASLTSTKALSGGLNFQFPPRNRHSIKSTNVRNSANERSKSQANITKVKSNALRRAIIPSCCKRVKTEFCNFNEMCVVVNRLANAQQFIYFISFNFERYPFEVQRRRILNGAKLATTHVSNMVFGDVLQHRKKPLYA